MKRKILNPITLFITATVIGCCNANDGLYTIEKAGEMPGFEKGYEYGVSACYAASTDNELLIAGGCNFPGTPAAEGGKKVYYNGIYKTFTDTVFSWEKAGELPEPSAYGVSVSHNGQWYIIGGMNSEGSLKSVYSIEIATGELKRLPSLPYAIDNAAGTIYNNTLYIIGGNDDGKASTRCFALDIETSASWYEIPSIPGLPRVQPVCAAADGHIYVWGGFSPKTEDHNAIVHCDGLRYDIANFQWEHIGNIMAGEETITLSGGVAINIDETNIIACGGVDKDIFLDAISGQYELVDKKDYMYKPAEWYKFNNRLMLYNTKNRCWNVIGTDSNFSRAGAQLVKQGKILYQIGGELKPGIRTPEIYRIKK